MKFLKLTSKYGKPVLINLSNVESIIVLNYQYDNKDKEGSRIYFVGAGEEESYIDVQESVNYISELLP